MTITGDYLFITLILLALGLMVLHLRERTLLLAFAPSMVWLSIGLWLFFGTNPPLNLANEWTQILAWVFVILTFIPWINQMNTEVRHEAGGKRWSVWGSPPTKKSSVQEDYRKKLRDIYGRRR